MGRSSFTQAEIEAIRRLLREKGIADRDRQKAIRGELRRKYNFYITDFSASHEGFAASDLDTLVSRGTVIIEDIPPPLANTEREMSSSQPAPVLPDVLGTSPRLVICGTAVGAKSASVQAYYAGPGNQFWPVLERIGLTPRRLKPQEFRELLTYQIGLTDLAKFVSGSDDQLGLEVFNREAFRSKMETLRPRAVAFNGKRAAQAFLNRPVAYGRQPETIGETAIFALPSTSGAARGFWDESYWSELADFVRD